MIKWWPFLESPPASASGPKPSRHDPLAPRVKKPYSIDELLKGDHADQPGNTSDDDVTKDGETDKNGKEIEEDEDPIHREEISSKKLKTPQFKSEVGTASDS